MTIERSCEGIDVFLPKIQAFLVIKSRIGCLFGHNDTQDVGFCPRRHGLQLKDVYLSVRVGNNRDFLMKMPKYSLIGICYADRLTSLCL